jgi:hypothetical protein
LGVLNRITFWRRFTIDARVASPLDLPRQLRRRGAIVIGSTQYEKWIAFECPCRRGHQVLLNLDASTHPVWRVRSRSPLTLTPSVDEHSSVGHCHYTITSGVVMWVERPQSDRKTRSRRLRH